MLGTTRLSLLAAAVGAGLALFLGNPVAADELADVNALILENPGDVELNLQYALIAEGRGKYRLALAAYERILLNDPDNASAKRGLIRVRRIIQPAITRTFLETGVVGQSNAEHAPDPGAFDILGFGRIRVSDERNVGGTRWRTEGTLYGEAHSEADQLDYASATATLGPIYDLGASMISLHPAIGGGVAMLDGDFYYVDVNASATLEGVYDGAFQRARLRLGYRQYEDNLTSDNGIYIDAVARAAKSDVFAEGDVISLAPIFRWNNIDGTFNNGLDDFSPGKYLYGGARLAYHREVNDLITLGVSFGAYDRYFLVDEAPNGDARNDVTIRPGVSVLFRDVFAPQTGIRFNYDFEHNDSNDPDHSYDNHIFGLSLIMRR